MARFNVLLLTIFAVSFLSCSKSKTNENSAKMAEQTMGSTKEGTLITLTREQATRFQTTPALAQRIKSGIPVTARTVVSFSASQNFKEPLAIFESTDISLLYADYIKDKAKYDRTSVQFARLKELQQNNAASGKDLLDAQTENAQAETEVRESEGRLRQLGFNPKLFNGMSDGEALVSADIPESKIRLIRVGETGRIEFNSYPDEIFDGKVISIGEAVDPQTRMVRVLLKTRTQKGRIKVGMFARVKLEEDEHQAVIIPTSSIVSVDAKNFAFVATNDSTFERRQITVGETANNTVEVLSGVSANEHVAIQNVILLKGMSFGY